MPPTTCSRCGSELEPTAYGPSAWRCCPKCEPQMFPNLIPPGFTLVPQPAPESIARSERLSRRRIETE